jgi:uncharacterized protein
VSDRDVAMQLRGTVESFLEELTSRGEAADSRIIESHVSLVLLPRRFAYTFKKPVNLGFLDFTSLDSRRYFCEREVALNARFSPGIYLGV